MLISTPSRLSYLVMDLEGVGITVQALTACSAMAERGHDVELVVIRRRGLLADESPKGFRIVELLPARSWKSLFGNVAAVPALVQYLRTRVMASGTLGRMGCTRATRSAIGSSHLVRLQLLE